MQPRHTLSIGALLASSVLLTIGRGATLPFMTIYLNRQYHMAVDQIGIAMSIALTVGVFFSLGFGILADRFEKKTLYAVGYRRLCQRLCGYSAYP